MAVLRDYNLTNTQRSVLEQFEDLRSKEPTIVGQIALGGRPTNTKHEWLDRQLSEATTTISTAPSPAASGTEIIVADASGANIAANDLLWFTSSTGAEVSEIVQVTDVSTNTLTVTREKNSTTAANLAVGDIVHVIKPTSQGYRVTDLTTRTFTAPTAAYNYCQTITRRVDVSEVAQAVNTYGNNGLAEHLADQVAQAELSMLYEMNGIFWNGYRDAAANTTTDRGNAGGIKQFTSGGVSVSTGGVVTLDHFNDAYQTLYENGANPGTRMIAAMSPAQARRVTALNTSGTNPYVIISQDSPDAGYAASTRVLGDIPGVASRIVVDPGCAYDDIWLLDMSKININYLLPFQIRDGKTAEGDGVVSRVLSATFTYTIKNGTTAHARIYDLTI